MDSSQLADVIKLLSRSQQVSYNTSQQMKIIKIVDIERGIYRVTYNGNEFEAESANGQTYKIGDKVLVKLINNDISLTPRLIEYKFSDKISSSSFLDEINNSYSQVGLSIEDIYEVSLIQEKGFVVGKHETFSYNDFPIAKNPYFQSYANNNDFIQVQAKFRTAFNDTHTQGNYGIKFIFKCGDSEIEYILDMNNFVGDPYNYYNSSIQKAIFQIPSKFLTSLHKIELFEENFQYDNFPDNKGQNKTIPNLFISDISLFFVEKQNIELNQYYLNINSPKGTIFTSENDELYAEAILTYNDVDLTKDSNTQYFWYKRDPSILLSSPTFDKTGGVGWDRIIDNVELNKLVVTSNEVLISQDYKVVCIYNGEVQREKIINFSQLFAEYDISIKQELDDNGDVFLFLESETNGLKGDWYVTVPPDSTILVSRDTNRIKVNDYLFYNQAKFQCKVYHDTKYITTVQYFLTLQDGGGDIDITYAGATLHHYDANGDIEADIAEAEYYLLPQIVFKSGQKKDYKIEWIGPDNQTIGATKIKIANSLFKDVYVQDKTLFYKIERKFNVTQAQNNILRLKITTFDGDIYEGQKQITFLKDGDQGTNGTTYSVVISPVDNGNTIIPFGAICFANGDKYSQKYVAQVFKDGVLQSSGLTYTWKVPSTLKEYISIVPNNESIVVTPLTTNINDYKHTYISLSVNINNAFNIAMNFPIAAVDGANNVKLFDIQAPKNIVYSASGYNPQVGSNEIRCVYNKTNIMSIEPIDSSALDIENNILKPAYKFPFSGNNYTATLKFSYGSIVMYYPIFMSLNTYGNEAINGWDGTSIETEKGHIFAPQIGAGSKNSNNAFTGVVMGDVIESGAHSSGLFGYKDGVQKFALSSDGNLILGFGDTIQLNGNDGIVKIGGNNGLVLGSNKITLGGGNGLKLESDIISLGSSENGIGISIDTKDNTSTIKGKGGDNTMTLKLKGNSSSDKAINVADKFTVDYNGNGSFTGTINAGSSIKIGPDGNPKFQVDSSGNVIMDGSISLNGAITWGSGNNFVTETEAETIASNAASTAATKAVQNEFKQYTYLDKNKISSPNIYGGTMYVLGSTAQGNNGLRIVQDISGTGTPITIGFLSVDVIGGTTYACLTGINGTTHVGVSSSAIILTNGAHTLLLNDSGLKYDGNSIGSGGGTATAVWG